MELLEMYFWVVIFVSGFFNFPIIVFSEDLKNEARFNNYLKIAFSIGLIGIFMIITGWNYYCGYLCLVYTFSPFITLLVCKSIMILSNRISKKEGFQLHKGKLSDGFYQKNKGDLMHKIYYGWYTGFIMATPVIIFTIIHILLEKSTY